MVVGQRIAPSVQFCQEEILEDLIKPVMVLESKISSATINYNSNNNSVLKNPGKCVRSVLLRAELENRIIIGLPEAVKKLAAQPDETLFCILVPSKKGDSATHMQEVLLRAFCFESDIYTVQVDNEEKLGRIVNAFCGSCVLVQKSRSPVNSPAEEALIDFCEDYWDEPIQPVVPLPET